MILVNGEKVQFTKFPNGETKLEEESVSHGLHLMFPKVSFKYENDGDLVKLMFVKNYLDSIFKDNRTVLTVYYMPYSRMDRSEDRSAFTLKYVANFINNLNFYKVRIVEPHSDVTNALIDNVEPLYVNVDLLPKVIEQVGFHGEVDRIFYPDAGASKRYVGKFKFPYMVGNKSRDFKTGRIEGLEIMGDCPLQPRTAIIVDDLSSKGGTFIHSAKALREIGFKNVYLLVAHCEDTIFDGEIFKTDLINGVFTTNTIISKNGIWINKQYDSKLKVYDIEGVLSND
jgi:ribose-phosphate pyrophosphokinase